jgi:hypothetical protein
MLEAEAAAELLGEFAAWEIGRALLMTTTISSQYNPPARTPCQNALLTKEVHNSASGNYR